MKTRFALIFVSLIGILMVSACNLGAPNVVEPQGGTATFAALQEQAFQTAVAQLTEEAMQTPTNLPTVAPTEVPDQPTQQPTEQPTSTQLPTATQVPPTAVPTLVPPTATSIPVTPTATKVPTLATYNCSVESFAPQFGQVFDERADFDGRWTLKNTGSESWEMGSIDFVYYSGTKFQTNVDALDIPKEVDTGETVEFIIDMMAPDEPGTYSAVWTLRRGSLYFCTINMQIVVDD